MDIYDTIIIAKLCIEIYDTIIIAKKMTHENL